MFLDAAQHPIVPTLYELVRTSENSYLYSIPALHYHVEECHVFAHSSREPSLI